MSGKKKSKTSEAKKELESQEELRIGDFVLDSKRIKRPVVFTLDFWGDTGHFGMHLPKLVAKNDEDGNFIGLKQVWVPVLVTSDHEIKEAYEDMEISDSFTLKDLPSTMPLRWTPENIDKYRKGQSDFIAIRDVFDLIKAQYEKYMFFSNPIWYLLHPLWDLGTYYFMLFNTFPILELTGLQETGKSKHMTLSSCMTLNATDILINPSEAFLFREVHTKRPTKYIDEAEKLFRFNPATKQQEADLRAELINASYYRHGSVPRYEKQGNKFVCINYQTYSPTVVASIKGLYGATLSRSISHTLSRVPPKNPVGQLDVDISDPAFQVVRDKCYVSALQNFQVVRDKYASLDTGLSARANQVWKPVLAIASLVGADVYEKVAAFAREYVEREKQDFLPETSMDFKLLKILKELLGKAEDGKVYIADVVKEYKQLNPDKEYKPGFAVSVSIRLGKLGFRDFRKHGDKGNCFELTPETFNIIVSSTCPQLSTKPSEPSEPSGDEGKLKKYMKGSEGLPSKTEGLMAEGSEGNEGNEGLCQDETPKDQLFSFIKSKGKAGLTLKEVFAYMKERKLQDFLLDRLLSEGRVFLLSPTTVGVVS